MNNFILTKYNEYAILRQYDTQQKMFDYTMRDAISAKHIQRRLKWRVYRKEWDWCYYHLLKKINPVAARCVLLEYFTSRDTSGIMGNNVVRYK